MRNCLVWSLSYRSPFFRIYPWVTSQSVASSLRMNSSNCIFLKISSLYTKLKQILPFIPRFTVNSLSSLRKMRKEGPHSLYSKWSICMFAYLRSTVQCFRSSKCHNSFPSLGRVSIERLWDLQWFQDRRNRSSWGCLSSAILYSRNLTNFLSFPCVQSSSLLQFAVSCSYY